MSFSTEIKGLIDEGYDYDDILDTFIEISSPEMKDQVQTLQKEGFSSEDMVSTLLETEQDQEPAPQDLVSKLSRGVAQGTVGFGHLIGLGEAAIQAPLTYGVLSPEEREIAATPGMEARTELEKQPDLTEFEKVALYGDEDDLISQPILPGQRKVFEKLQEKIPEGGKIQESVNRITRSLPWLAGGPVPFLIAVTSEFTGLGSSEVAKALGFGETGQLIADVTGGILGPAGIETAAQKLTPKLAQKVAQKLAPKVVPTAEKAVEKAIPRIAKKPITKGEKAITKAELITNPKKVQNEINKLSTSKIEEYQRDVSKLSKDSFSKPEFSAREVEDVILRETKDAAIKTVSPTVTRSEEAWNIVAEGVNKNLRNARDQYRGIYKTVEKQAEKLDYGYVKTNEAAKNLLQKFNKIETQAKGQATVEKALNTLIRDLKKGKPISVDKGIAAKRNLSDIVNYEDLSPSVKDLLRPIIRTLKSENLQALEQRSLLKTSYQKAETQFAQTAETYGKDAIRFLRAKDAPETAATRFLTGSNLKYLKESLKGSKEAVEALEGQILQEISKKSVDAGREILKETSPYLSNKAKDVANDIIQMGDKLTSPGSQALMRGKLLESVQKAAVSGERPEYALKLMQNPTGYKITKDTLSRSPKGKKIWEALQHQTVEDIFKSIETSGEGINWNKAKDLLKDPHTKKIIKDAVGEEGLKFFEILSKQGENITNNFEQFIKQTPQSLREQIIGTMGYSLKSIIYHSAGGKAAWLGYLGLKVVPRISSGLYYRMLASPKIRNGITKLLSSKNWKPEVISPIIEKLNEDIKE